MAIYFVFNKARNIVFPILMVAICLLTVARYRAVQDFRNRSVLHGMVVESEDIDAVEKALRGATFQPVKRERISGDRYRIVVRCQPESVGYISKLIDGLGAKQFDD